MTHKIKIVSLLMVSAMLFFVGCKKNNPENETNETQEETFGEHIPEEILQLLDNCPSVNYQDLSAFGFNGKSDNPLDYLFAAMCQTGMRLTDTTEYVAGGDTVKEPRQKGLAYVFGYGHDDDKNDSFHYSKTKDYRLRRRGYLCKYHQYLHGIDCAGFIAHVMNSVGIGEINKNGTNKLFEMQAWQQADYFKNLNHKTLKSNLYTGLVKVEKFENVRWDSIKNGDIIYKIKANGIDTASHIGVFFKTADSLIMFQSSGNPYTADSTYNLHENDHGPIQKNIIDNSWLDYYFLASSGRARLLRITVDSNWVDLGLPSKTLWATRNVGANSPEESGYYFAWGETQQKPYYDWDKYKYWTGTTDWYGNIINGHITKYNENDTLKTLQSVDDAANVHWSNLGNNCRMPTKKDWDELIKNCTPTWAIKNGVKGVLFNAKNGESLFLPAVGFRHLGGLYNTGQYDGYGFYWTSSLDTLNSNNASYVRFNYNSENPVLKEYLRLFGLSIRPVCSPD